MRDCGSDGKKKNKKKMEHCEERVEVEVCLWHGVL